MEVVILCGVQGSGKTTLYRDRFLNTHEHVSLDIVRSRAREAELVRTCLEERRPFVVDNTNPTPADRRRYVDPAREVGFKVIGYLVEANAGEAFARADIPPGRVAATARALQRPTLEECFDELWHATAAPGGGWRIEPLLTTPPLF
jgi:predicted kinase